MPRPPATAASREFGRRLRAQREKLHLTQERLAQRGEMSYSTISDLERGRANPTFDVILKLAQLLDTDPGALLSGLKPDDA
ncbi:helix-turn-helix domain-containing protein [Prauserella sp. PE36]|uniref:helix-turn-helix domain-containing protein n=1 Tax=Prauserella sp. PE36 TaxID=1504709 RepID=UPI0018F349BC|nr:helix-turn-helix transcriptional regulator [Prauserella sp. PE36]